MQNKQSMISEERRHWHLSQSLIRKNAKDISTTWRNLTEEERTDEFTMLVFVIALARVGNFEEAKRIGQPHLADLKPRTRPFWHLFANSIMLRLWRLGLKRTAGLAGKLYLLASGMRKTSAFSSFARMYLDMWTDHERALPSTTTLLAKHLVSSTPGDVRYLYFHGFILALNGMIDEGLMLCESAVATLKTTASEEPFYSYWLHEGQALLATVAFYAGDVRRALSIHNDIQNIFQGPEFFPFNEVYNSSMALRVALAARDHAAFCRHSQLLKTIMGEQYDLRFALRTYSFQAVFDLLRHDQKSAYVAISRADSFAEKSPSRIELFYHYTQKSRLFLVDGMLNEALSLARQSTQGITGTSGGGFHVADALFQHLRCMLVGHTTLALPKEKANHLLKEEAEVFHRLRKITRHSKFLKSKLDLYRRLLIMARCRPETDVLALIDSANRPGYDLDEVTLAIANQKMTSHKIFERNAAMQSATRELERLSSLNDFLQKITGDQQDSLSHLITMSEEYLSNCIGMKISAVPYNETHGVLQFRQNIASNGRDTFIRPFDHGDSRILKITDAGTEFGFSQDVIEMINVWWQIANSRLSDHHRQTERMQQSRYKAIAQTTQMLAHDVRKPFSILRGVLKAVQNGVNDTETLIKTWLPDVERAMDSVNGMIEDVMEIDSESCPETAEVALEGLIGEALQDQFRFHEASLCRLSYRFEHKHLLRINQRKISRVFSNIIANAVEATGTHGHIWFKSSESPGFIEVVIGNEGREIDPDRKAKIFEPFFTAEKAGGTGLGLAIAKKIVEAHGGRIWCCSEPGSRAVTFHFLLPTGGVAAKQAEPLPESAVLYQNLESVPGKREPVSFASKGHYIVVDDDAFIRYAWTDLAALKNVAAFASPDQFWSAVQKDPSILAEARGIATDYHFANETVANGFEFAAELREKGYIGKIIMCSESDVRKTVARAQLEQIAVTIAPKDPIIAAGYFN